MKNFECRITTTLQGWRAVVLSGVMIAFAAVAAEVKPAAVADGLRVTLTWDVGTPLTVTDGEKTQSIDLGKTEEVTFDGVHRMRFQVLARGEIFAESLQGTYDLHAAVIGNAGVSVGNSEAVTMILDRPRGFWGIRAGELNTRVVQVASGAGFSVDLPPKGMVTFSVGPAGIVAIAPDPNVLFASASAATGRAEAIGLGPRGELNVKVRRAAKNYTVSIGERIIATSQTLLANGGTIVNEYLSTTLSAEGKTLMLKSWKQEAQIEVVGMGGWSAQLAKGDIVSLTVDEEIKLIDQFAAKENAGNVRVTIKDAAALELKPGDALRYDVFKDDFFVLSTSDKSVIGKSQDGFVIPLGGERPEYVSGPAGNIVKNDPNGPWRALWPAIPVQISGTLGMPLSVTVSGTNALTLTPGQTNSLDFTNFARIEFAYPDKTNLRWSVPKGDFAITIAGLAGWEAVLLTGERGAINWDTSKQLVELANESDERMIGVSLPDNTRSVVRKGEKQEYKVPTEVTPRDKGNLRLRVAWDTYGYQLFLDSRLLATSVTMGSKPHVFVEEGIVVSLGNGGESLTLGALDRQFQVSVAGIPGWTADVGAGDQVEIRYEAKKVLVDVLTPAGNRHPVQIKLDDGAELVAPPGRWVRYDLFSNSSYYFVSDARVKGTNSDGDKAFQISREMPPWENGPPQATLGTNRLERLTPGIPVKVAGELGGPLSITAGTNHIVLSPGETNQLNFENCSVLQFKYNTARSLVWRVPKGDFKFTVSGIPGWQAYGLTEEAGILVWDVGSKAIDLKNISGPDAPPLVVMLPSKTAGVVGDGATLQFSSVNKTIVVIGGVAGDVQLVSMATGRSFDLDDKNLQIIDGKLPNNGSGVQVGTTLASMSWDNGSPLVVAGSGKQSSVEPNSEKIIEFGNGGKVKINYAAKGDMTAEAMSGDVQISIPAFGGITVDLKEGEIVTMNLDTRKGSFSVRAGGNNPGSVTVFTGGSAVGDLGPDAHLEFKKGKDGLTTVSGDSGSVNFAAGSASGAGTAPDAGGGKPGGTTFDTSRIKQDDLSPFKTGG